MPIDDLGVAARLASGTSRRSVLARVGQSLIAAAMLTVVLPRAAAASSCTCASQSKCGIACGSTGDGNNSCCLSYPPCVACGGGGLTTGTGCNTGAGFYAAWYWYCCVDAGDLNELWKCQDCCHVSEPCYTVRTQVGTC